MALTKALIAFVGLSGTGKSTCYRFAERFFWAKDYRVFRADVALPLRILQTQAYQVFHLPCPGNPYDPARFKQDGQFLGVLAKHFDKYLSLNVRSRVEKILAEQINSATPMAIINTDCRNNAYPALKNLGFLFIKLEVISDVLVLRRKQREDLSPYTYDSEVEQIDLIEPNYVLRNNGSLDELAKKVQRILRKILKYKK